MNVEHHLLAILSCNTATLELLSLQPDTDACLEMRELLEAQYDIVSSLIHGRHYGSDGLDEVIHHSNNVLAQVKEFEEK
jgi:hypothetical protein